MQLITNSTTLIIVIHEIYGINEHMKKVCQTFASYGYDVLCPNLLNRETPFNYAEEKCAYQNFTENIGFQTASEKVKSILRNFQECYEKVFIVGFSIGATVAWICSEDKSVNGVIGYYGSRIRSYLEIIPKVPVLFMFPEHEQSFDVHDLQSYLKEQGHLIYQFKGEHGFSDPFSKKYREDSAQESLSKAIEFIKAN